MIVIVGGGLAGLVCAKILHHAGQEFVLLEAQDALGGSQATTRHADGYLLDRGFQVVLDSYPAVRRHFDIPALQPLYFESGALLHRGSGEFRRILNPLRHKNWALAMLRDSTISREDKKHLRLLIQQARRLGEDELLRAAASPADITTLEYLQRMEISPEWIEEFFRPFFGGVFLENSLHTSAALFQYYLRHFAYGRTFIPESGIQALPKQLAEKIPADRIQTGLPVTELRTSRGRATALLTREGEKTDFEQLILAVDEPACAKLLQDRTPRRALGVWTIYLSAREPAYSGRLLVLPTRHNTSLQHFCDLSNLGTTFAPAGRRLLSCTVLEQSGQEIPDLKKQVMREVSAIFPHLRDQLEVVDILHTPHALLRQPAGFAQHTKASSHLENVILAGDHTTFCSIQGALLSGERAAAECLRRIRRKGRKL